MPVSDVRRPRYRPPTVPSGAKADKGSKKTLNGKRQRSIPLNEAAQEARDRIVFRREGEEAIYGAAKGGLVEKALHTHCSKGLNCRGHNALPAPYPVSAALSIAAISRLTMCVGGPVTRICQRLRSIYIG